MSNPLARIRWRSSRVGLIASGLAILGFALCEISWWFFVLVALGVFGPGIARELGWLRDQDEFQRRAAHRAGHHAYLVGGLMTFILIAAFRAHEQGIEDVARRWPRMAGVLLVAFAAFFFYFFGLYKIFGDDPLGRGRSVVIVLFVGPLLASGIALLRVGRADVQEGEA